MASKKQSATKPVPLDDKEAKHVAQVTMMPGASAAAVIQVYGKTTYGEANIALLVDELRGQFDKANAGDLKHCEAMLLGQAEALQAVFVSLARRAAKQEYLKQYETYLRLALKAQNQSRMTLETLAALKNPPVVIARQANIAHGPQQVNNGAPPQAHAHPREIQNEPNELLEANHGKRLDTGTAGATSEVNQELEAVGAIHRA